MIPFGLTVVVTPLDDVTLLVPLLVMLLFTTGTSLKVMGVILDIWIGCSWKEGAASETCGATTCVVDVEIGIVRVTLGRVVVETLEVRTMRGRFVEITRTLVLGGDLANGFFCSAVTLLGEVTCSCFSGVEREAASSLSGVTEGLKRGDPPLVVSST